MPFDHGDLVYDIECLPNLFLCSFVPMLADDVYVYEISERRNDARELMAMLGVCRRMFGFNNMAYDWPMLHYFLRRSGQVTAWDMFQHNERLFAAGFAGRFQNIIWQPSIQQVDMFMMHHMDRFSVGLKQTEFNMRSSSVMDMPIEPGTMVTPGQIDGIIGYNIHDIRETKKLVQRSASDIEFREGLGAEWMNYNDGKIGKKFFENELRAAGVQIYDPVTRAKRSTPRDDGVRLADVILPFIRFTRPAMVQQLERFREERVLKLIIEEGTKKKEKMLRADGSPIEYVFDLDGFHIDVKLGGIHGSLKKECVTNAEARILDFDVTSYYPSIAIVHRIYPQHLGPTFCDVYGRLKTRRVSLPKEHPDRATLKFSLNVPFGDSNNRHGIFYDPAYMLAITINGQLMLCMLAEQFANVPDVKLIQVNTDGVTVLVPAEREPIVREICAWWQRLTGMDLEETEYRRMFIRDSNNYLAEGIDGKRKRKGAYDYKRNWRQDHSELVVAKAAEAAMLDDIDPTFFITEHDDPFDFMMFRKGRMELSDGVKLPKNIRYYVSHNGNGLFALHPPLKGKTDVRRIGVHAEGLATAMGGRGAYYCSHCNEPFTTKGAFEIHNKARHCWKITIANEFNGEMPPDIDHRYYVNEAKKLIIDG